MAAPGRTVGFSLSSAGATAAGAAVPADEFYSSAPSIGSAAATTPLLSGGGGPPGPGLPDDHSGSNPAAERKRASSSFSGPRRPPTLRSVARMHPREGSSRRFSLVHARARQPIPLLDRLCCNYTRDPMTLRERLTLSALQKWRFHGRFPFKLLLHVFLLLFSTAQILVWNFEDGGYYRATNRNWQYWFLHYDSATSSCDLFTYDEVISSLNHTVTNYYAIDDLSVDSFNTHKQRGNNDAGGDGDGDPAAPLFVYQYYEDPGSIFDYNVVTPDLATAEQRYYLNNSYAGPFDEARLGKEAAVANINKLSKATLTLRLDSFLFGTVYRSCLEWVVYVVWDFRDRGQVKQSVTSVVEGACTDIQWGEALAHEWLWLNFPVVFCAVCYCALSLKAVISQFRIYLAIRRRQRLIEKRHLAAQSPHSQRKSRRWHGAPVTWGSLSCRDKFQFFTVYLVLNLIACVCLTSVGINNLVRLKSHSPTNYWPKLFTGAGCALVWFSLLQYFEQNSSYSILIVTLKRGVPRVGRFMVGVMPMMLGYALFGMVCFGSYSDRFSSFSAAMITLFAVLNGDVIRETFLDLNEQSPFLSQVYMYTFICLFIYVVLNVFIAIIEEAFFSAWEAGKRKHASTRDNAQSANAPGDASFSTRSRDSKTFVEGTPERRPSMAQRFSRAQYNEDDAQQVRTKREEEDDDAVTAPEAAAEALVSGGGESKLKYRKSQPRPVLAIGRSASALTGTPVPILSEKNRGHLPRGHSVGWAGGSDGPSAGFDEILAAGNSWNRFRELLHNIETDELEQRHQDLHGLDRMVHDEVERRRRRDSPGSVGDGGDAGSRSANTAAGATAGVMNGVLEEDSGEPAA